MNPSNRILAGLARQVIVLATAFLIASPQALAAIKTWDGGGGDSLWSNPLNWNNDSVPVSGDTIRLDSAVTIRLDVDFNTGSGGIETTSGFAFGVFSINSGVTLTSRSLLWDFGFFENRGTITSGGPSLLTGFDLGTSLLNHGSIDGAFLTIGTNAIFENRVGTLSNSQIRFRTGSQLLNNSGTLTDVSMLTGLGSGATIINSGDIPDLGNLHLANTADLFENNGTVINRGDIKNRGTIDNSAGLIDNRGRIFNECTSDTSTATPAVFIGSVIGTPVRTTCRIFDNDAGNRLWSEPLNWTGDAVPDEEDLVVIADIGGTASAPILDVDFDVRNELIVHAFSILSVRPAVTLTNRNRITVRGGAILVDGTFRNLAEMRYSGASGGTGNLSIFGLFDNDGAGVAEFLSNSSFFNGGNSTNSGGEVMNFADGSIFNNTTTFNNNGEVNVGCGVDVRNSGQLLGNRFLGLCKRWDGGGGSDINWSNPLNWSDDELPQPTDTILIDFPGSVRMDQSFSTGFGGSFATGPGFLFGVFAVNSDVVFEASRMDIRFGFFDNAGTVTSRGNGQLIGLDIGTLFSNRGTLSRIFATVGHNAQLDNRFGVVTDGSVRLGSDSILSNLGTIDDISVSTLPGSGAQFLNDGQVLRMPNLYLGNAGDVMDNNGSFVSAGNAFNRGRIENGGSFDIQSGSLDNPGTFVSECDSVLLGRIDGNPPVVEPCDVIPPEITVSGSLSFEATSSAGTVIGYSVSANDNVDGPVAVSCTPPNSAVHNLGVHAVNCAATDAAGNTGNLSFDVTVVDTTAPALTVPDDVEAEASALLTTVGIGTATADDFYPVTIVNDAPAGGFPLGATQVTWTATDSSGNESTVVQTVVVVDTTPPVITAPADIEQEASALLTPADVGPASAIDIFGVSISNDAPAGGFPLGTTVVTWTATDDNGNSATATQSVTIVDTTPPELTLPDDVVAEANAIESAVDIGVATATDIFPVTVVSDAPATYPLGTTVVTWTATDSSGNVTIGTQQVTVVDTTPPELTVPEDIVVTAAGLSTPVDIGTAEATDIFPVAISKDAPAGGQYPVGVTQVTWRAEDANGNVTTAVQTIRVEYAFSGFLPPFGDGSVYKLNRTVPVKFQLFFADGSPALGATAAIQIQMIAAGEPSGEPIEGDSPGNANSGNLFRISGDQYVFNLGTSNLTKGAYRILVTLDDGSAPKFADVGFK